jgi:hypothetical protein
VRARIRNASPLGVGGGGGSVFSPSACIVASHSLSGGGSAHTVSAHTGAFSGRCFVSSWGVAPGSPARETGKRQNVARSSSRDRAWETCPGGRDKTKWFQKPSLADLSLVSWRPRLGDLPGRPGQGKTLPEALPGKSCVSCSASVRGRPARETGTRQNVTRSSSRQVFRQVPGVRARETCPGVQDKAKYYQKLSQACLPSASGRPRLRTYVVRCCGAVHSLGRQGHRNTQPPAASHSCQPQLDSHSSATEHQSPRAAFKHSPPGCRDQSASKCPPHWLNISLFCWCHLREGSRKCPARRFYTFRSEGSKGPLHKC